MVTRESRLQRGRRRGRFLISRNLGELHAARVNLGISQATMGRELGCSQATYSLIEVGKIEPTLMRVAEIASILGMEMSLNLHPIGDPVRDRGQQAVVKRFRTLLAPAWRVTAEMPLPVTGDQRAWDLLIRLGAQTVGIECETRIRDIQALARRIHLRERDGGTDHILIVLSDSATNRRLANELREALGERYLTPQCQVLAALRGGTALTGSAVILL